MFSTRNAIIAIAATCWLLVLVDGQPPWYPQWSHHNNRRQTNNEGVAEDPNNINDNLGWSWGSAGNRRPNGRTTTAATPTAATAASETAMVYSDAFYECMSQCRTTNEWNPVCGSDNNDYNNIQKLNCANMCGGNVQQQRRGPCRPFGK